MTAWTDHVKKWAKENNTTYGCAVSDPRCSASYHANKPPKEKKSKKTLIVKYTDYPSAPIVGERFYSQTKKALYRITNKALKIDKEFISSFGVVGESGAVYITDEPVFGGFHLLFDAYQGWRPEGIITKDQWDKIKDDRKKKLTYEQVIRGKTEEIPQIGEKVYNFFKKLGAFSSVIEGNPVAEFEQKEYYGEKETENQKRRNRLLETIAYYERKGAHRFKEQIKDVQRSLRKLGR